MDLVSENEYNSFQYLMVILYQEYKIYVSSGFFNTLQFRETNARLLANASAFWAGWVENWPERVEFCKEYIKNVCFGASTPEI